MRSTVLGLALVIVAGPALAEAVLAARTIRAREIITAADLSITAAPVQGALNDPGAAIGREARYTIYAGRPVNAGDLTSPAVIERNDIVVMFYDQGGLSISTEGRALGRGAVGDRLRVMNLASRSTVTGTVAAPGRISIP